MRNMFSQFVESLSYCDRTLVRDRSQCCRAMHVFDFSACASVVCGECVRVYVCAHLCCLDWVCGGIAFCNFVVAAYYGSFLLFAVSMFYCDCTSLRDTL